MNRRIQREEKGSERRRNKSIEEGLPRATASKSPGKSFFLVQSLDPRIRTNFFSLNSVLITLGWGVGHEFAWFLVGCWIVFLVDSWLFALKSPEWNFLVPWTLLDLSVCFMWLRISLGLNPGHVRSWRVWRVRPFFPNGFFWAQVCFSIHYTSSIRLHPWPINLMCMFKVW